MMCYCLTMGNLTAPSAPTSIPIVRASIAQVAQSARPNQSTVRSISVSKSGTSCLHEASKLECETIEVAIEIAVAVESQLWQEQQATQVAAVILLCE